VIVLTDEQRALVESIRDFARRECGTRERRDTLTDRGRDMHNVELYKRTAELGWVGVAIDERYGGTGGSHVDMCLVLEETTRGRLPTRFMSVSLITGGIYERYGTEAQKQDVLRGVVDGEVISIGISEPEAGSDAANISCRAERANDGWRINGQKTWTTGAHKARQTCVVCRTDRSGPRHQGLTMLTVPMDADGVEVRGIETMGDHEVNDVFFTDVVVPDSAIVGAEGGAWRQLMAGLNHERLVVAAFSLGLAQRAFDDTLAYVSERRQFGHPIGSFQSIRHRLANLATELECCRLLLYSVAQRVDAEPEKLLPREASMAKLKITETARQIALEGMQMMGGYGYAREYDMVEDVVQALPMTVYAGTSEVQLDIIAKTFGLTA
jgi:isovaleryl-CoA dehydrogenase